MNILFGLLCLGMGLSTLTPAIAGIIGSLAREFNAGKTVLGKLFGRLATLVFSLGLLALGLFLIVNGWNRLTD